MGGIDLLDMMSTLYKRQLKSKRWYLYIFYHTITISVVNAWFLYRRDCAALKIEKPMPLKRFQAMVAEELIPESQAEKHSDVATIGVMVGFAIMMTLDVALG